MSTRGENISIVLVDWLEQEVKASDEGRNASLSEFEERVSDFDRPFNDASNVNARKVDGHYDRLRGWAPQYLEFGLEHDDYATARLVFCSLMFISGNYRVQCMLEAVDGEGYRRLRHEVGPTDIDLVEVTESELGSENTLAPDPNIRISSLIARTLAVNESNLANAMSNLSLEPGQTPPSLITRIDSVRQAQEQWTSLAVAQIMVAASFRGGDYSLVPFFEPKSITDQDKLLYPLASQ